MLPGGTRESCTARKRTRPRSPRPRGGDRGKSLFLRTGGGRQLREFARAREDGRGLRGGLPPAGPAPGPDLQAQGPEGVDVPHRGHQRRRVHGEQNLRVLGRQGNRLPHQGIHLGSGSRADRHLRLQRDVLPHGAGGAGLRPQPDPEGAQPGQAGALLRVRTLLRRILRPHRQPGLREHPSGVPRGEHVQLGVRQELPTEHRAQRG